MSIPLQVLAIGDKGVDLLGHEQQQYLDYPNASTKTYVTNAGKGLSIRFSNEYDLLIFIQELIINGVPFLDTGRAYAYYDVSRLVERGKVNGPILKSTWSKDQGYELSTVTTSVHDGYEGYSE